MLVRRFPYFCAPVGQVNTGLVLYRKRCAHLSVKGRPCVPSLFGDRLRRVRSHHPPSVRRAARAPSSLAVRDSRASLSSSVVAPSPSRFAISVPRAESLLAAGVHIDLRLASGCRVAGEPSSVPDDVFVQARRVIEDAAVDRRQQPLSSFSIAVEISGSQFARVCASGPVARSNPRRPNTSLRTRSAIEARRP